jgi:hypothetical protein
MMLQLQLQLLTSHFIFMALGTVLIGIFSNAALTHKKNGQSNIHSNPSNTATYFSLKYCYVFQSVKRPSYHHYKYVTTLEWYTGSIKHLCFNPLAPGAFF